jgi:peptide/nickel transport system substrate-binding protein
MAQQAFSFDNEYSYVDETRILHVLGEVRNGSGESVREVLVSASFRDSEGNALGEFKRIAEYRLLAPGEVSPFEILFLNQEKSDLVANYTLTATALPAPPGKNTQMEILSSKSRLDLLGTLYINAVAMNHGNLTSTNTLLIATLYDSNDKVIAIGRALAEAVRGTADIPASSEGAFGVVIADKLQTYKAAKYSLVVQSDQYASDRALFKTSAPGQTMAGGNQTQSGCLIATAAFGSEFAPQVQLLRQFRDNIALKTIAGSSFMNAFNLWYYSFSPAVAEYERNTPWVRDVVRVSIQPLLLILDASTALHGSIISVGMGDEFAIISVGLLSSSLIGLVYLSPGAVLMGLRRKQMLSGKTRTVIILSWCASALLVATGISGNYVSLLSAGTVSLVLCSMITTTLFVSDRIAKL